MAVDTLGHLLAVRVTAANEGDRTQVEQLAQAVQEATGHNVQVAYVDAGYTGEQASEAAKEQIEILKRSNMLPTACTSSAINHHYHPCTLH